VPQVLFETKFVRHNSRLTYRLKIIANYQWYT